MKANQRTIFIFSLLTVLLISFAVSSWVQAAPPQRPVLGPGESNWKAPASPATGIQTTDLNTLTSNDLVQALIGSGPDAPIISSVTYTGANIAAGTFSGGTGIIGFADGIILSSGNIASVVGPNVSDATTTNNGLPGDPDLDNLIPGYQTFDATVLEFDFECQNLQVISFQYVFASEEYNEYVNSPYNNVFGFFLNGVNIALLPSTTTPVSINNVNCNNPYSPPGGSYCNLFINNDLDDGGGAINTEMDGMTVVLTATATVTPGVNRIKLAIADAGDYVLDSDIFIKGESFVCAPPNQPPACNINPPGPFNIFTGDHVSFVVTGTDPDPGDILTITATGMPPGATMTPPLLLSGPSPQSSTFGWTPSSAQVGVYTINFTIADNHGLEVFCDVRITVSTRPVIPILSQWGLIALMLVLLALATWVFFKRRKVLGVRS